jgi:hypothetical protein
MTQPSELCLECGGHVVMRSHVGSERIYRGVTVVCPDVPIPTCQQCMATWMEGALLDAVYGDFERQYQLHRQNNGPAADTTEPSLPQGV